MSGVVRLSIIDPNESTRNELKNMLIGVDMVWLEAECSRYEFFTEVVSQTQPDIALISLDANPEMALNLIAQVTRDLPTCNVIVVSSSQEGSLILKAMRNGAKEFLGYPLVLEDFLAALNRIQMTSGKAEGDPGAPRSSQVITVAGVSGGVGCTSLAINLACCLANNERNSVAVIDLDLALGDTDVWLDIIPDYTIQDVAENISRLDYSLLKRSLTKHSCGAFLLPRPVQMDMSVQITTEVLKRIIALLRATFTHLVIDVSKSYNSLDMAAMELSDSVLLTAQLDLPCLRNVVRLSQFFDNNEYVSDKIKVVMNRLGLEDTQISISKALETIGRDIFCQIPNDYATMVESRNNGVPLVMQAPKAKLTRTIMELASSVGGEPVSVSDDSVSRKKKSLFGFLNNSK
ncbi:AAA family ATPase [Gimesia fumaroli]|jgi:pilus assembly protein CpaE|uniref:CobQ/CobB/MinD/ParA nucleotide binding domain protein n=1 Tax=Gimesia fumaroli TaxID=2527976 RepID=A0A518ICH7_9PLAN|nr:AAA family ATPase [Gimesia fumaroli]QDV50794.1 CobQ/CobB/MinD/ParA nucleotide binding domain protein [Gimesia fumaroli]